MIRIRPLVAFLLAFSSLSGFCQENLKLGDDLYAYLKDNPPEIKGAGQKVIDIPEGTVDFFRYKRQAGPGDIRILVILDKYAVGVLQSESGRQHLLYDLTGDGLLDTEVTQVEIPYWVVARNTAENLKTATNNIKQYLDGYYRMFQQDPSPVVSGAFSEYADRITKALVSGPAENRDLLFALSCCYRWGVTYPAGTVAAAEYLSKSYFTRFRSDHNLFYLQFVESYIKLGERDEARKLNENLLKVDPGYVPAQVYRWQLETDPDKRKAYFADLTSRHPNHWIVKQLKAD